MAQLNTTSGPSLAAEGIPATGSSVDSPLWSGLDRILATAPSEAALHAHGLGPVAAWRRRIRGEGVPDGLAEISRRSAYGTVTVNPLLERIRAAIDGPIVLIKGPEVASLYPSPPLRPFGDLDLVVEDLQRAETQLLDAGFVLLGPADHVVPGHHHDRPMRLPGMALAIELHRNPGWLNWQRHPTNADVFARAVPSGTGVDGILAMPPTDRALLLAAHSWRHGPFYSYIHLLDLALARNAVDQDELLPLAREWGLEGVWRRLDRAIDAVYFDEPGWPSGIDRIWSRHLLAMREQTLLEYYAGFWLKGLVAPDVRSRATAVATDVRFSLTAHPWQTRSGKIRRIGQAGRRSLRPHSEHRFG